MHDWKLERESSWFKIAFKERFPRPSSLKQETLVTHVLVVFELFQNTGAMSPMPSSSGLRRQMLNIAKALGFTSGLSSSTHAFFFLKNVSDAWVLVQLTHRAFGMSGLWLRATDFQTLPDAVQVQRIVLGILLGLLQTVEWIQLSADNLHC